MSTRWVGVMALAAMGLLPSACMAQWGYGYGHHGHQRDSYGIGYDRGFEEGARHGRVDGHRHESYNFSHDSEYRRADEGYRRSYGSYGRYRDGFRSGYERGYRRSYDVARREHRGRGHHCELDGRGVSGRATGGYGRYDDDDDEGEYVGKANRRRY
jgi:hypothetical protein